MKDGQRNWIDNASYESLLYRWRHADMGDVIFQNDAGDYYKKIMLKRKDELNSGQQVSASKSVGWDGK